MLIFKCLTAYVIKPGDFMTARSKERILILFTAIAFFYLIMTPLTILIAHSLVTQARQ